jgi:hypothetical protein
MEGKRIFEEGREISISKKGRKDIQRIKVGCTFLPFFFP